jgi:hypothetical protein
MPCKEKQNSKKEQTGSIEIFQETPVMLLPVELCGSVNTVGMVVGAEINKAKGGIKRAKRMQISYQTVDCSRGSYSRVAECK